SDFFNVIDSNGKRQMIVVESDSSPAGQELMPSLDINKRHNGYKFITQTAFKQALKDTDPSIGELAILSDLASDEAEATGFAAAISEETKEHVWIVMLYDIAKYDQLLKWENKIMHIKDQDEAGGQNKVMAAKSFELFNTELSGSGLAIRFPKTVYNVNKSEIYSCIEKIGGRAVIKSPYGRLGIYTITNSEELKEFFDANQHYQKFIVQSLVESALWSTELCSEKFYHIGIIPNCNNQTFVNDLRIMVTTDEAGFHPVTIVSRRAREPLSNYLPNNSN
ncbi:12779_t:CDS:2, partial [Racocetra fulgida]